MSEDNLVDAVSRVLQKRAVEPRKLLRAGSRIGHWFVIRAAYDLYWLVHGGVEGRAEHKFRNDARDMEYALLGLSGVTLATEDGVLRQVYSWSREALQLQRARWANM